MKKELELLAPAGTLKTLKAVINAGADAVYFGGSRFGARAYAGNFTADEVYTAIDYGHIHDRKIIMAINTLLKNEEIKKELYDYLLPVYEYGIDAVIVQDFGVMQFLRNNFPDLPIHTSTQMTVTGVEGASFLAAQGASRIVMARELSGEEIAAIHQAVGVEIESFVHGALCYSYSGACLLSSMLGGRSGNRGRCAQPCRLPYEVLDENKRKYPAAKGAFILSPKDLCTIENIPRLAECGVYSFKIEGRMKQTEYAAGVVSIYRKYMDQYLTEGSRNYAVTKDDMQKLLDLGNRSGFTGGCYQKWNGADMITFEKPGHQKSSASLQKEIAETYIDDEIKESINGFLTIKKDLPATLIVSWDNLIAESNGDTPAAAQKQPLTVRGLEQKIRKTGGTPFAFDTLEIECEDGLFLPIPKINELRRDTLDKLMEEKTKVFRRKNTVSKESIHFLSDTPELKADTAIQSESGLCISASAEQLPQLLALLEEPDIKRIYIDSMMFERASMDAEIVHFANLVKAADKQVYFILPSVFRKKTSDFYRKLLNLKKFDGYLAKSYDGLSFLLEIGIPPEQIVLDHSLYTYSDEAKQAFLMLGLQGDTVPLELNKQELRHRSFIKSEMIIYGCLPLMTSVHCINRNLAGCGKQNKNLYLKDRYGMHFPVKNNCSECYNIIYNSKPLCLFLVSKELIQMGAASFRLSFTFESSSQIKQIISICRAAFLEGKEIQMPEYLEDFTYGHFKRGVE